MIRRNRLRFAVGGAAALALLAGAPAYAQGRHGHDTPPPRFTQINRVSDLPGTSFTDADAVNSWGLALGPTTPLWVSNNGTSVATVYAANVTGPAITKVRRVTMPADSAPTGTVFNDTTEFVVPGTSDPARFIFVSESGNIFAWNPAAGDAVVTVVPAEGGAVYKGVSILHTSSGPLLLATDFHNARIDVFNGQFQKVNQPSFQDRRIPEGFAPFNVMVSGDKVYVTYAKQDAARHDDVHGPGLGFVNLFTNGGMTVQRIASHGTLNAPWGLTIAPDGFGKFTGDLIVGNFGDGRINVFRGSAFQGQLRDKNNKKITIDGLWALLPGTATTGGTGTLWFSAGPDNESHGLVGQLIPTNRKS